MKKLLIIASAAAMLVSFGACQKKVDPKDTLKELISVMSAANGDCDKAAKDVTAFFAANKDSIIAYAKDQVKAGKSEKDIFPSTKEDEKKLEELMDKCMSNPAFLASLMPLEEISKVTDGAKKDDAAADDKKED